MITLDFLYIFFEEMFSLCLSLILKGDLIYLIELSILQLKKFSILFKLQNYNWLRLYVIQFSVTIKVLQPLHVLKDKTNDDWGNHFESGSRVVSGLYYDHKSTVLQYSIIPKLVGLVYADVVFHIVAKEQTKKAFTLSDEENMEILSVLENTFEI